MTPSALERIGALLTSIGARGSFASRRTSGSENLHLSVTGVGPLRFPISRAQAMELCRIAQPARYGRGERTLLDARVRATHEVPKQLVKIDRKRWDQTLVPVLEQVGGDLGLPDHCTLRADFHSMLVYAPGQFFLPHRDSEKSDDMIGTLVVTLPSSFKGGAFTIEHGDEKLAFGRSRLPLTFIAFYADCRHEVRPVKQGYRVVLTYNLMLREGKGPRRSPRVERAAPVGPRAPDARAVGELADLMREHFQTPLPPPKWPANAPPRDPPRRLVYLLDHQYTERGLSWDRLKGHDASRAAAFRAAAEDSGCELLLALAEVNERWGCQEDDCEEQRSRRWEYDDEEDEWHSDDTPRDDPDRYVLGDLEDSTITLRRLIGPTGARGASMPMDVHGDEILTTTPSSELTPYASEYEGYMGNYGNTMDRWYRRAALVLWPRDRAFALRAEASPSWAMTTIARQIRAGAVGPARDQATSLSPFWARVAPRDDRAAFMGTVLTVACGVDSPDLAAALLAPFRLERLAPQHAAALAALAAAYGKRWMRTQLGRWSMPPSTHGGADMSGRLAWLPSLPRLCEALCEESGDPGSFTARVLLDHQWSWLRGLIDRARRTPAPGRRDKQLAALARPTIAVLESALHPGAGDLVGEAIAFLCADDDARLLPCLIPMLRLAQTATRDALGLATVRDHCVQLLESLLALPARQATDWSIEVPRACDCHLCEALADFLRAAGKTQLIWPLAKESRRHVHQIIDANELPVRHETTRSGSPYKLVLTKTAALFEREASERSKWRKDLDWLLAGKTTRLRGASRSGRAVRE